MNGNGASRDGMERAAAKVDARYAVAADTRRLTHRHEKALAVEPVRSGAACACGARSSDSSTRRLFLEHREMCAGSAVAATKESR